MWRETNVFVFHPLRLMLTSPRRRPSWIIHAWQTGICSCLSARRPLYRAFGQSKVREMTLLLPVRSGNPRLSWKPITPTPPPPVEEQNEWDRGKDKSPSEEARRTTSLSHIHMLCQIKHVRIALWIPSSLSLFLSFCVFTLCTQAPHRFSVSSPPAAQCLKNLTCCFWSTWDDHADCPDAAHIAGCPSHRWVSPPFCALPQKQNKPPTQPCL